jgi:regulator of replication initiation timing
MLNWRPVREIEQRTKLIEQRTRLIEKDTEQIKRETEQLRQENAKLKLLNAKTRHLISCVDQLCFPPESSSNPAPPTASDCKPSSP